ncbi:MAG: OmpA family protein [Oscillatoriales cyanobacterium SM2_1_8]|nr:OmpA family protein [Oscillatoriales cyanobacterium SM2_1_8]
MVVPAPQPFARANLTVYFPHDSTLLTPLQRQRLRDFWQTHSQKAGSLQIMGHADDTGNATHNDSLAEQRAWAVVAWLRPNLSDRHRLQIGGQGDRQPVHADPAFNRRVELTFVERLEPKAGN